MKNEGQVLQSNISRREAGRLSRSLQGALYHGVGINHAKTAIRFAVGSSQERHAPTTVHSVTKNPYCS